MQMWSITGDDDVDDVDDIYPKPAYQAGYRIY